ncbi:hypothetical protein Hamer_G005560 [Homarus americanus]|uniref:Uncharacterized protein n=1 Tax=Homarus americanus TaxID=6706 RepID=A0A8J5K2X1_HOMAM|nr:hypothetical protein Hamer_G005560 [Homarus americanus]
MDKRLKLVNGEVTTVMLSNVDWNKCIFCEGEEDLSCPVDYADRFGGKGYKTLAKNLVEFHRLGQLPSRVELNRFDECDGLEATCM